VMSEVGQTEKNSQRAYVFRFASELRHCSTRSAFRICAKTGLMHCDKRRLFDYCVGHGRAMAARTRLATVDQLLRKALAVLDASGTADGFNNLGGRNIMDKIS
jgi:hypothetical protein